MTRKQRLADVDLGAKLAKARYSQRLKALRGKLRRVELAYKFAAARAVIVIEGWDAVGKGGVIRRMTSVLDPRGYQVWPIGPPSTAELSEHYLQRFWRRLPHNGRWALFDRSWYGRVLVERIEGYCSEADWMRAYSEINDFEEQLVAGGGLLCKFWLQISPEEQLRRFEARKATGFKRFKITDEDWRNREKWPLYQQAAADMIDRTSTGHAPWTLIEAEDKNWARIKVLRTLVQRLKDML